MSQLAQLSDANKNFSKLYHQVLDDREVIFIQENDEQVALIAADELSSLLETAYLLRSPNNAERLLTALQRAKNLSLPVQDMANLKQQLLSD